MRVLGHENSAFGRETAFQQEAARGAPVRLDPGLPSLKEWFRRSDLSLTQRQYEQLWRYHKLLREGTRNTT